MVIYFFKNSEIYLFSYVLLPILLCSGLKIKRNHLNFNPLSFKNTEVLRGFFILVVILHHISKKMSYIGLMFPFKYSGYLAVGIFFFISGYGLMTQSLENHNYFNNFVTKRLVRVYVPFIVINIVTLIGLYIIDIKYTFIDMVFYSIGIKLIDDITWYVLATLYFYSLFYATFANFSKCNALILTALFSLIYFYFCYLLGMGSWWYNCSFCFLTGIYTAMYKKTIEEKLRNRYYMYLISSILIFIATSLASKYIKFFDISILFKTLSSIVFVLLILIFLQKIELNSKLLYLMGTISYEVYLLHMKIYYLLEFVNVEASNNIYSYILILIVASIIFKKLIEFIRQKLYNISQFSIKIFSLSRI